MLKLLIGIKAPEGYIKATIVARDGGSHEERLLYKFYRTADRVNALVESKFIITALGMHLRKTELDRTSPSYNKEVTMLPVYIGFPDEMFYHDTSYKWIPGKGYVQSYIDYFSNEEKFYDAAKKEFSDCDVVLFDTATKEWLVGIDKKPLRQAILDQFDEEPFYFDERGYEGLSKPDEIARERDNLIAQMDAIDEFIEKRNERTTFLEEKYYTKMDDDELLQKYNSLVNLAYSKGIKITGCFYEVMNKEKASEHRK